MLQSQETADCCSLNCWNYYIYKIFLWKYWCFPQCHPELNINYNWCDIWFRMRWKKKIYLQKETTAPPPTESRKSSQSVNLSGVRAWWGIVSISSKHIGYTGIHRRTQLFNSRLCLISHRSAYRLSMPSSLSTVDARFYSLLNVNWPSSRYRLLTLSRLSMVDVRVNSRLVGYQRGDDCQRQHNDRLWAPTIDADSRHQHRRRWSTNNSVVD